VSEHVVEQHVGPDLGSHSLAAAAGQRGRSAAKYVEKAHCMSLRLMQTAFVLLACMLSCSCASVSTIQPVAAEKGLKDYKRAYIEALPNDEFQLYQALLFELTDMGIEVVAAPFKEPLPGDLLVRYSFDSGWDFTKYLKAFRFEFIDAGTNRVVASTSYRSVGLWLGVRDRRLESAFNDLRTKQGFPPTSQFK
jgi:hypothetical protein